MATFGKTDTTGTTRMDAEGDFIRGCKFHLPERGEVSSVSIFGYAHESFITPPRVYMKCAIYDSDFNLKAVTEGYQLPETPYEGIWLTFNISPRIWLDAGDYWLCWWASHGDGGVRDYDYFAFSFYRHNIPDALINVRMVYNDFPTKLTNIIYAGYEACIYATYTPEPAPPTWTLRVESTPISVPVTLNGASIGKTPVEATVEEGDHIVEVPQEVSV